MVTLVTQGIFLQKQIYCGILFSQQQDFMHLRCKCILYMAMGKNHYSKSVFIKRIFPQKKQLWFKTTLCNIYIYVIIGGKNENFKFLTKGYASHMNWILVTEAHTWRSHWGWFGWSQPSSSAWVSMSASDSSPCSCGPWEELVHVVESLPFSGITHQALEPWP